MTTLLSGWSLYLRYFTSGRQMGHYNGIWLVRIPFCSKINLFIYYCRQYLCEANQNSKSPELVYCLKHGKNVFNGGFAHNIVYCVEHISAAFGEYLNSFLNLRLNFFR
mgnify:CR=1 FL=1